MRSLPAKLHKNLKHTKISIKKSDTFNIFNLIGAIHSGNRKLIKLQRKKNFYKQPFVPISIHKKAFQWLANHTSDVYAVGISTKRIAHIIKSFENKHLSEEKLDYRKFFKKFACHFNYVKSLNTIACL
jgi:hypothetical protein